MNTTTQRSRIMSVLSTLRDWNEPILKTELIILVEPQNYSYMVGLLDALCFGGLIHFDHSDADARLCWVSLSREGERILSEYDAIPF